MNFTSGVEPLSQMCTVGFSKDGASLSGLLTRCWTTLTDGFSAESEARFLHRCPELFTVATSRPNNSFTLHFASKCMHGVRSQIKQTYATNGTITHFILDVK